ncbi:hypothetical protein P5F24_04230 [Clostridium perfringens]|nr:hypothetical protein [Clostridium perfringens]
MLKDLLKERELLKQQIKEKDKIIEDLRERCDKYFNLYMQEKENNNKDVVSEVKELKNSTRELKELVKKMYESEEI